MPDRARRKYPRWQGRGLASQVTTSGRALTGMSVENISMGGVFLRTGSLVPLGTPLSIELVRRGLKRVIVMSGRVVSLVSPQTAHARHGVPGLGVKFDPYPEEVEGRLRDLLAQLAEGAAPAAPADQAEQAAPYAAEAFEPGPVFAPEHEGAGPVVAVPADARLQTRVWDLQADLERTREELEQNRKMVATLRGAIEQLRGELMRKEQENDELAAQLRRALERA